MYGDRWQIGHCDLDKHDECHTTCQVQQIISALLGVSLYCATVGVGPGLAQQ
jgi:hypothetical protein